LVEPTTRRANALRASERELRDRAEEHGQGHLFGFWDDLDEAGREELLVHVASIDFDLIERLVDQHLRSESAHAPPSTELRPAPVITLADREENGRPSAREVEARARGEEMLRSGEVAAFVVAGGQGTRLGWDAPKGTFPIGPVTSRTLFQYFAEQILALSRRYGTRIPWYVMTSEANDEATRAFLAENRRFGLPESDVSIFPQDMLPAVDAEGRILLESPSRVFRSPNGHGGSIKALYDSGAIDDMRRRGIRWISYFQVDNPLVPVCDPVFLGYHALASADMSSKVVHKSSWDEKVGVIGRRGDELTVIEYSDLPEELARETDEHGHLKWWAGSIAIHVFSVDFVLRLNERGFSLPYHVARKRISHVDPRHRSGAGVVPEPQETNGVKFETFVFDALGHAREAVTLEVRREDEFSPVKNAEGKDSAETCRRDLTARNLRWLEAAGARIERDASGGFPGFVEIGPLTAIDAMDLRRKLRPETVVRPGFII